MLRWLKRLMFVLGALILLVLVLVFLPNVPGPSTAQRAAIDGLRAQRLATDSPQNGYAAYWYFYTDLALDDAAATLRRELDARRATGDAKTSLQTPSATRDPLPPGLRSTLCADFTQTNCLKEIAARRAEVDALLQQHAVSLLRARQLMMYTEMRDPTPRSLDAPFPPLADQGMLVVADAVTQFLDGRQADGMQQLCGWAWHWRQMMRNTDMLLAQMIGASTLVRATPLYAQMNAARDGSVVPPAVCAQAFAPLQDAEIDQCEEMAGEFANFDGLIDADVDALLQRPDVAQSKPHALATHLMFKREHTRGRIAAQYWRYCDDAQRARVAAREPIMLVEPPQPCGIFENALNYAGCIMSAQPPSFEAFYERLIDVDALLRAHGAALWLAEQPQIDATTLGNRPIDVQDQHHRVELVEAGTAVRVYFGSQAKRYGEFMDLPIRVPAPTPQTVKAPSE